MSSKSKPQTKHLQDYCPPAYLIPEVQIEFELDPQTTIVHSTMHCERNSRSSETELFLNGEHLELVELRIGDQILNQESYSQDEKSLTIRDLPEKFELRISTKIHPEKNLSGEGLYLSGETLTTQMEAEGFRRVTYFPDRPDVMSKYVVSLTADKKRYPNLLANGNLVESKDIEDGKHLAVWEDPFPKPCYLFAVVAGDLTLVKDCFTTRSGREVSLEFFVEKGKGELCRHAIESLKKSMKWDEDVFGLEYDLDIYMVVAVDAFNAGAMENKGLNIFNTKYVLADQASATDDDYLGVESVIAHEYFHNWTGNRVTCRDWFQLTLKEGLTVLRDNLFSEDTNSAGVTRIQNVRKLRQLQFSEDAGPNAHPIRPESYIEINNFYTLTVYEKGAEVIRMLYTLFGRDTFTKGITKYFELYDGRAVTTEDFLHALELASDTDLTQFSNWYHQYGTPKVSVKERYDENANTYTLKFTQKSPDPKHRDQALHIPIALKLFTKDGADINLSTEHECFESGIYSLRTHSDEIVFKEVQSKPTPSLLRNFSAPVTLDIDYSFEDLVTLVKHDDDEFARFDASQSMLTIALQDIMTELESGESATCPSLVLDTLEDVLFDDTLETELRAEIVSFPSLESLNSTRTPVDFSLAERASILLGSTFAKRAENQLLELYRKLESITNASFDISPVAMGARKLKNICLKFLCLLEEDRFFELAEQQYFSANNMTDQFAALSLLSHTEHAANEKVLSHFADRWSNNALVMDKWFIAQAFSKRADTISRIENLAQHQSFSIKNPNKVRSLYSVFSRNLPRFHDESGKGYELITNVILEIDPFNPQIAARLCNSFQMFKRLDPSRKVLMKTQLDRIIATSGLSDGVFELVSKTLAE